jgi:hypothetical protein
MRRKLQKTKDFVKSIGPNTREEVEEIHRGVYDGFVRFWRPDSFAKRLKEFRDRPFEEFESNNKHYYVPVMVASYTSKYIALFVALKFVAALGI